MLFFGQLQLALLQVRGRTIRRLHRPPAGNLQRSRQPRQQQANCQPGAQHDPRHPALHGGTEPRTRSEIQVPAAASHINTGLMRQRPCGPAVRHNDRHGRSKQPVTVEHQVLCGWRLGRLPVADAAGIMDADMHLVQQDFAEQLAHDINDDERCGDRPGERRAALFRGGGRRAHPVNRQAHRESRRAVRIQHQRQRTRRHELAGFARAIQFIEANFVRGQIQAQNSVIASPRRDMAHHDIFVALPRRFDDKGRLAGVADCSLKRCPLRSGNVLRVEHGPDSGMALPRIQARDVFVEYFTGETAGGSQVQRTHADQHIGIAVYAGFDRVPRIGRGIPEVIRNLAVDLRTHRVPGQPGQDQAGRKNDPRDRSASAIQNVVLARKIQTLPRITGRPMQAA